MQTTVQSAVQERLQIMHRQFRQQKINPEKKYTLIVSALFSAIVYLFLAGGTGLWAWYLLTGQTAKWMESELFMSHFFILFFFFQHLAHLFLLLRHHRAISEPGPANDQPVPASINHRFEQRIDFRKSGKLIYWPAILLAIAGILRFLLGSVTDEIWSWLFAPAVIFMLVALISLAVRTLRLHRQLTSFEQGHFN